MSTPNAIITFIILTALAILITGYRRAIRAKPKPHTGTAFEKRHTTSLAHMANVIHAREAAIAKHPEFPSEFSRGGIAIARSHLTYYRNTNKTRETAESVLMEEIYELIEAVLSGDAQAAHAELAQCMAVLIRIGENMPLYIMQAQKENQ